MLASHPRTQLCLMLKQYGRVIMTEPKRCKGLLRDLAPHNRLEINLLIVALEQKIVDELLKLSTLTPIDSQLERLAQRLHEATGIEEKLAYWAVESWALALCVIQQPIPKPTASPIANDSPPVLPLFSAPAISRKPNRQVSQLISCLQKIGKYKLLKPARSLRPRRFIYTVKLICMSVGLMVIIFIVTIIAKPEENITKPNPVKKKVLITPDNTLLPLPEQREAWTENNLGDTYYHGYGGVAPDYQTAAHWYRRAAEQGDAIGQCNLGFMYTNGYGVPKDYQQAAYWYRKAAEQGDADGQNNTASLYENGYGVPKDTKQAEEWYRKAAEQGHYGAQHSLKALLEKL